MEGDSYNQASNNAEAILKCTVNADKPHIVTHQGENIFFLALFGMLGGAAVNFVSSSTTLSAGRKPERKAKPNN